jgi:hypothetical protein
MLQAIADGFARLGQNPPAAPGGGAGGRVKFADPRRYGGERGNKANIFVEQCGAHIESFPSSFPNETIKINFAISYLDDAAYEWSRTVKAQSWSPTQNAWVYMHPAMQSWGHFQQEFLRTFGEANHRIASAYKLQELKQGKKTMASYASEFTRLCLEAGVPMSSQYATFMANINPSLRRDLARMPGLPGPEHMHDLIDFAISLDQQIAQIEGHRRPPDAAVVQPRAATGQFLPIDKDADGDTIMGGAA